MNNFSNEIFLQLRQQRYVFELIKSKKTIHERNNFQLLFNCFSGILYKIVVNAFRYMIR